MNSGSTELFPMLATAVDAAVGDAYARAGAWMACRPGCNQCCIGVFPVSTLDTAWLQAGLATAEPAVAAAIQARATDAWARLAPEFPGNSITGELFTEDGHEEAFEDFANDEPCPVLDPATGTCSLYSSRPIPCRTFGPPMPNDEGGLGVCELCFVDAPESEVARSAVDAGFLDTETQAVVQHETVTGTRGPTLIAFALANFPAAGAALRET